MHSWVYVLKMKEEKNDIIYTAEDIKRYITGAMNPQEMHAIEMAALDDPLLAEAMEGYDLMEQKDWSKELADLKHHFSKEEKQETPVIAITQHQAFKWWKAAAAVLVVGIAAFSAYLFTDKNKAARHEDIAKVETTITSTDSVTIPTKADSSTTLVTIATADSNNTLIAQGNATAASGTLNLTIPSSANYATVTTTDNLKAVSDSTFMYRPPTDTRDLIAMREDRTSGGGVEATGENDYKVTTNSNYPGNAASQNNAGVYNNAENEEGLFKHNAEVNVITLDKKAKEANNNRNFIRSQNSFSGLVLDKDNQPLGYATVKLPQSKKPVHTDANGMFTITAPDSTLNVVVSSAGFNAQKFNLQSAGALNKITLVPQPVVTEKVVTAKSAQTIKRQQAVMDSALLDEEEEVAPEGGWTKYNNYLSNNLRFPTDAKQKNIHGEVEVTVKLSKNGDISQVSVDKPLCPDCDAEAVRLVKEGPKWDVKNTKKKKVKVKVKF